MQRGNLQTGKFSTHLPQWTTIILLKLFPQPSDSAA
jgi:hypothetical protein